jgi:hypothetical protein
MHFQSQFPHKSVNLVRISNKNTFSSAETRGIPPWQKYKDGSICVLKRRGPPSQANVLMVEGSGWGLGTKALRGSGFQGSGFRVQGLGFRYACFLKLRVRSVGYVKDGLLPTAKCHAPPSRCTLPAARDCGLMGRHAWAGQNLLKPHH